jgi:hypothetical protein
VLDNVTPLKYLGALRGLGGSKIQHYPYNLPTISKKVLSETTIMEI